MAVVGDSRVDVLAIWTRCRTYGLPDLFVVDSRGDVSAARTTS